MEGIKEKIFPSLTSWNSSLMQSLVQKIGLAETSAATVIIFCLIGYRCCYCECSLNFGLFDCFQHYIYTLVGWFISWIVDRNNWIHYCNVFQVYNKQQKSKIICFKLLRWVLMWEYASYLVSFFWASGQLFS